MTENDILSVLCGQNNALVQAFDPEYNQFRNEVITLQKNCPMIEWEPDMGGRIPFCKLDNTLCHAQCAYRTSGCPCE